MSDSYGAHRQFMGLGGGAGGAPVAGEGYLAGLDALDVLLQQLAVASDLLRLLAPHGARYCATGPACPCRTPPAPARTACPASSSTAPSTSSSTSTPSRFLY